MSAAIAMAPSPAPHDRPSFSSTERPAPSTATSLSSPSATRTQSVAEHQRGSKSPRGGPAGAKSSPPSASRNAGGMPKIVVKKEPHSPDIPAPRHRPRKLDLSKGGSSASGGAPSATRPLTARDGLAIHDVGIACLSPGFVTRDPVMKEQLQRSMSVKEQQRHIIEARLQQQSAKGDGPSSTKEYPSFTAKTPGLSRRNKAPPGLSIVAPSHEHFANERVVQSAPLNQTFTGMHQPHMLTRHIANQPSKLSNTSHIHHVPANQTNNRLPPITDVFGQGLPPPPESAGHSLYPNNARGPLASPGHPPHHIPPPPPPTSGRPRDYKSAEEAQVELAAGRPELLPKLVHYGGHQPPTPPSPHAGSRTTDTSRSSRRRNRTEYEDGASPPLGNGPTPRRGPFGSGRDTPETQRAKREEFLQLCERAWDLFHS